MSHVDSASVYRENGRVYGRFEMGERAFAKMLLSLGANDPAHDLFLYNIREKHDRSDIMARFDDVPVVGDQQ